MNANSSESHSQPLQAPTKVGNSREREAVACRGWSLRDLFLSLFYGLLFGSLAFLTGCLEGSRNDVRNARSAVGGYDDFKDKDLEILEWNSLQTELKQPFSINIPISKWPVINVFDEKELKKVIADQTGPLVVRALDSVRITEAHTILFPLALAADQSALYPRAAFNFTPSGKLVVNGQYRGSAACSKVGSFAPRDMQYLGLFGNIESPVVELQHDAQITIETPNLTVASVTATDPGVNSFVTFSGGNPNGARLVTNGVWHIVLNKGYLTKTKGQVLALDTTKTDRSPDDSWCMDNLSLANYVWLNESIQDPAFWVSLNNGRCRDAQWRDIIEAISTCQSNQVREAGDAR